MLPYIFLIFLAFSADRLSKWWAAGYLAQHGETTFNAYFTLRETYNRGIAFGLFQGIGPLVGWLTVLVLVGLFIYLLRLPRELWLMRSGVAILIGGALGNLIDRITVGAVLDFIETPFRSGIFNVADVMIYIGLGLLLLGAVVQKEKTAVSPPTVHQWEETH